MGLVLVALAPSCQDRTLTEADCSRVKARLEAAWERDALSAQRSATSEMFLQFVREERDRVGSDWMAQCHAWVGRPLRPAELSCLDAVDTIDDVFECER